MGAPIVVLEEWRKRLEDASDVDEFYVYASSWNHCAVGEARERFKTTGKVLTDRVWPSIAQMGDSGLAELGSDFMNAIEKNDKETALGLLDEIEDRVAWLVKNADPKTGKLPWTGTGAA